MNRINPLRNRTFDGRIEEVRLKFYAVRTTPYGSEKWTLINYHAKWNATVRMRFPRTVGTASGKYFRY